MGKWKSVADVFLSHNNKDKAHVLALQKALEAKGIRTWLDTNEIVPGDRFREKLERALAEVGVIAVFIGAEGFGESHLMEAHAAVLRSGRDRKRIIPVFLPNAPKQLELPDFLKDLAPSDLRGGLSEPAIERLIRGIRAYGPPTTQAGAPGSANRKHRDSSGLLKEASTLRTKHTGCLIVIIAASLLISIVRYIDSLPDESKIGPTMSVQGGGYHATTTFKNNKKVDETWYIVLHLDDSIGRDSKISMTFNQRSVDFRVDDLSPDKVKLISTTVRDPQGGLLPDEYVASISKLYHGELVLTLSQPSSDIATYTPNQVSLTRNE